MPLFRAGFFLDFFERLMVSRCGRKAEKLGNDPIWSA